MNNCLIEKINVSLGDVSGLKRVNCVTSIMKDFDYPDSHVITANLRLRVGWNSGTKGFVKAVGDCFFLNEYTNQPLSYFRDPTNSVGTEFDDISGAGTSYVFEKGISSRDGGFIVGNKENIIALGSAGLRYDTIDLLGLNSLTHFSMSDNNFENVDFSQVFDYMNKVVDFRVMNGRAPFDLSYFKKTPALQIARMNQSLTESSIGTGGFTGKFVDMTGDIADLYLCTNLNQFEALNTAIYGDIYTLIKRYRDNNRTSGSIMIGYIGSIGLTFNGVLPTNKINNMVIWDSTHAYIALNTNNATTLQGKTRIYYIGYTAEEVATMKQGLWSGLSDANIIDCSDGGE